MPPRSSSPICERSLDLTLIGIGRRDIPQCSSKHFHMEAFYRTFSGGQRPSALPRRTYGFPHLSRGACATLKLIICRTVASAPHVYARRAPSFWSSSVLNPPVTSRVWAIPSSRMEETLTVHRLH